VIVYDESLLPLVVVVGVGEHDEADIADMYERQAAYSKRGEPIVMLWDARATELPNAATRKRIAEMQDRVLALRPQTNHGTAVVVASPLYVGAARAIDWIRGKMSNDQHYVSKAVDALPWLTQRLGGALPAGAREAARELDRQHERGEPRHRWPSKKVV
jgi:hypothetical protein